MYVCMYVYMYVVIHHPCNSYTVRAVWDLLLKPNGEGNKSRVAQGGCVITIFKAYSCSS